MTDREQSRQRIRRARRTVISVLVRTVKRYDRDHGELLAAGLAFYGVLSLAPLLLLAVMIVGTVFERQVARTELLGTIARVATPSLAAQTAEVLDAMAEASSHVAVTLSLLTLLWAASRLFVQLQAALNAIWGVQVSTGSTREAIRRMVSKRLLSFAMVAASGLLLMAVLIINTVLSVLAEHLVARLPFIDVAPGVVMVQNYLVFAVLMACFFAAIYYLLPDVRIPFRDVWVGAILTACLVLLGTALLSFGLGRMTSEWAESALGPVAAFVFWTYYQAQVFMLGVAFTREWAARSDPRLIPEAHAEKQSLPEDDADDIGTTADEPDVDREASQVGNGRRGQQPTSSS